MFLILEKSEETGRHRNQYLINSYENEAPFIYFKQIASRPSMYQCIWPCYIEEINQSSKTVKVIIGEKPTIVSSTQEISYSKPKEIEVRYLVRESKVRGHQAEFREEVLKAYARKCAISSLPNERLLQAAHIIPDAEYSGKQTVRNGIALNYLHHKAFDSYLIGIDADYVVHVSEKLHRLKDGPLLEHGILGFDKKRICLPRNIEARPDQDLLNRKFEKYLINNGN